MKNEFLFLYLNDAGEILEYLQHEKRYSPHTITSYRKDLEDFSHFYLKTESSEDIAKADKK